MSNSNHTPGPFWFAQAEDSARFDYSVGAGDGEIAHVALRADAVLFRTAPEMLATLRLSARMIAGTLAARGYQAGSCTDACSAEVRAEVAVLSEIEVTISRATGAV